MPWARIIHAQTINLKPQAWLSLDIRHQRLTLFALSTRLKAGPNLPILDTHPRIASRVMTDLSVTNLYVYGSAQPDLDTIKKNSMKLALFGTKNVDSIFFSSKMLKFDENYWSMWLNISRFRSTWSIWSKTFSLKIPFFYLSFVSFNYLWINYYKCIKSS